MKKVSVASGYMANPIPGTSINFFLSIFFKLSAWPHGNIKKVSPPRAYVIPNGGEMRRTQVGRNPIIWYEDIHVPLTKCQDNIHIAYRKCADDAFSKAVAFLTTSQQRPS